MKVSIVGITGYSGLELVRILHNHPKVELVSIHATKDLGKKLSDLYPYVLGSVICSSRPLMQQPSCSRRIWYSLPLQVGLPRI